MPNRDEKQTSIYNEFDKKTSRVQTWCVMGKDGSYWGKVVFCHPPRGRGEGRTYCYVHRVGDPMVRGWASGYGYCKTDAAFMAACRGNGARVGDMANYPDAGQHWDRWAQEQGYKVYNIT